MRNLIVAGNWKMNGSLAALETWAADVCAGLVADKAVEAVLFPPFVYLPRLAELAKGTGLQYGAQNVSEHASGAYTGEVSTAMLREFGCQQVIVGHSERRELYGETSEQVAQKTRAAVDAGLQAVLCVGETLEQREAGQTEAVVFEQLDAVLNALSDEQLQKVTIAYEPVWAIGTGKTATPEQAQAVHQAIRNRLAARSAALAEQTAILYGGSVKPGNAAELFSQPDIDGGLIGGASLKAEDFLGIYQAAVALR